MRSEIVITGLGPVSSIGLGPEAFWESLCNGTCGVGPIELFDTAGFHVRLGGEVKDLKIRDFVPKSYRKATKVMARDTELAVVAAKIAAEDAGLKTRGDEDDTQGDEIQASRVGCQIGAGLIAAETEELARAVVHAQDADGQFSMPMWGTEGEGAAGMNNLPPLWLLKYLPNMLACHVTIIHGLEGPSNTLMGAEASAILSIGESARVIERGSADVCFTGGAESRLNQLGLIRCEYAGRATKSSIDEDPGEICKPFQPESRGGIIGESGGMLVIESAEHAQNRGAKIYARITGFGAAQTPRPYIPSASELRAHDEIDRGLAAAIRHAMKDAGVSSNEIDAVFCLGAGQPTLDDMESGALTDALGENAGNIPHVTIAHQTGNTLAGHAGLMTIAAALSISKQTLPLGSVMKHGEGFADRSGGALKRVLVCTGSLGGQAGALILETPL